ncbi:MAG: hypothetical protein MPK30_09510, partial [Gammaproteobacteria bacterium]|nr:hypothetical protein [Gammaproteobacteria bacterium]
MPGALTTTVSGAVRVLVPSVHETMVSYVSDVVDASITGVMDISIVPDPSVQVAWSFTSNVAPCSWMTLLD